VKETPLDVEARLRSFGSRYSAEAPLPVGFHGRLMDRTASRPRYEGFFVPKAVAIAVPAVMAFLVGVTIATQAANRARIPILNPVIQILLNRTPQATPQQSPPPLRVGPEPATPRPAVTAGPGSPGGSSQSGAQGSRSPDRTPGPQGSAVTAGAPPACQAADLTVTTATDAQSYSAGQQVTISVTARNKTDHVCYIPADSHLNFSVSDSKGQTVWTYSYGSNPAGPTYSPTDVSPGQSITRYAFWDQNVNYPAATGQRALPGTYTATAGWDSFTARSAQFRLE